MPIYPTWAQLRKIRYETYGKGIVGWWKQGWVEYPEIMFAGLHAIFGCGLFAYKLDQHNKYGTDIRKYKAEYTVFRSDDPRLLEYEKFFEANHPQRK